MSTSMALLCAYAAPERSSACRCWASSASCPTGTGICSPSNCAGASRSRHGKAASTISSHEGCERRCWRSSTVTPGCDAPAGRRRGAPDVPSVPERAVEDTANHNTIERLHEEFLRRVKTQSSLPTEDSAVVLLFSLVASGQIRLRRVDGWQKIATVLSQNTSVAA